MDNKIKRGSVVKIIGVKGYWKVLEITSKGKCSLKKIDGKRIVIKDLDRIVEVEGLSSLKDVLFIFYKKCFDINGLLTDFGLDIIESQLKKKEVFVFLKNRLLYIQKIIPDIEVVEAATCVGKMSPASLMKIAKDFAKDKEGSISLYVG